MNKCCFWKISENMKRTLILRSIMVLVISCMLIVPATCKAEQNLEAQIEKSLILPDWGNGDYHDYYDTIVLLNEFNEKYPQFVSIFPIGESVNGKDIFCVRITNENNNSDKFSGLMDGCIHGHEWESCEGLLYFIEYLLINSQRNESILDIMNTTELYIVPIVNPDGRQKDQRWNENGVDLNRNFDIFFGKLRGHCIPLGKIFGQIKIPIIKLPFIDIYNGWYYNCGRYPFSEPETKALKDLMSSLDKKNFSFYLNVHTPTHNLLTPWLSYKAPFKVTEQEQGLFNHVLDWLEANTEYEPYRGGRVKRGGLAMDWCFKEFHVPSFLIELYSMDYVSYHGTIFKYYTHDHYDLVHWMKASLPFFMYLFVNAENLYNWDEPKNEPILPEGIPPPPLG